MNDNKFFENRDYPIYKPIIIGIIAGSIATAVVLLIMALILTLWDFSPDAAVPMSSIALAIGSFTAGILASKLYRRKGLLLGLLTGLFLFMIITLISLAVSKTGFSLFTLIRFFIIVLSSVIGGIMGVNTGNRKKII